jgi:hypothetical protein
MSAVEQMIDLCLVPDNGGIKLQSVHLDFCFDFFVVCDVKTTEAATERYIMLACLLACLSKQKMAWETVYTIGCLIVSNHG